MVHALKEIWRVLSPAGTLIDLRPFVASYPVEVVTGDDVQTAGTVDDSKKLADDAAADSALKQLLQAGLFALEYQTTFDFLWYWDASEEMKAYYEDKSPPVFIPDHVIERTQRLLTEMGSEAKIRVRIKMLISRYRKRV